MRTLRLQYIPVRPLLAASLLTGLVACHTHTAKVNPQAPAVGSLAPGAGAAAPLAPLPANTAPRVLGPQYDEYYVGTVSDPSDPTVTYQPGTFVVETEPARLRRNGSPLEGEAQAAFYRGPMTTADLANLADTSDPELTTYITRSKRALAALGEENKLLIAKVQELEKAPAGTAASPGAAIAATVPASANGALPPNPQDSAPNNQGAPAGTDLFIVHPDSEGVIALEPDLFVKPAVATDNPFIQLYQPPIKLRSIDLIVSAAIPGPAPSCVLNDTVYSVGQLFEDLTVYRVDVDKVFLRKDAFLLECPVSHKKLTLKLP